jgi:hypothetical protein
MNCGSQAGGIGHVGLIEIHQNMFVSEYNIVLLSLVAKQTL